MLAEAVPHENLRELATGDPVMSIGGSNGTDPAPTLAQFERYVAERKIRYFAGTNADSFGGGSGAAAAITNWLPVTSSRRRWAARRSAT